LTGKGCGEGVEHFQQVKPNEN